MTKHVISCFPDGVMEAVQNDEYPLSNFGRSQMTRASDVVWCEAEQMWTAAIRPEFRTGNRPCMFAHKSREKCIEWELAYLNNRKVRSSK